MTNNLPVIRRTITSDSMQAMIRQRIGEKAGVFTTSLLDLIGDNKALQNCDPNLVIKEAIKAPALDLPINNNLGFAYIIPYGNRPQFIVGYKGFIQLAIRTGQYKHLNADAVYEGEHVIVDKIRGTIEVTGTKTSDQVQGYFAYMKLLNGFEKAIFWTKEQVTAHAKKFSKAFNSSSSPWKSDFDAMAKKTLLKNLISKYGPLTIEMTTALNSETNDFQVQEEENISSRIAEEANAGDVIDINEPTEDEKKEIEAMEMQESQPEF